MTSNTDLAVIILNWNAATDTIRCIHSITAWKNLTSTIWVVDNASTDGSADEILRQCPNIHLIRNSTNMGFAGGNNRGIAGALASGNVPILLLNNDAYIGENDVIQLLETLRTDERIGFVGPLLFDAEDEDKLLSAGGKDPSRHHQSHILQLTPGEPVCAVECVPGTVVLVRASVFKEIGLLDEDYFFASEVADLCMQASRHGYISVIDARAKAFHSLERSSELRSRLHAYYIIRNRFLLIRKFHQETKLLFFSFWTLYSLALSLKTWVSGKRSAACAIYLGLVDGLRGRFGGQNERVLSICRKPQG